MPMAKGQLTDEKTHGKHKRMYPKRNKQITTAKNHQGKKTPRKRM